MNLDDHSKTAKEGELCGILMLIATLFIGCILAYNGHISF